jgi:hypothetical protein
VFDTLPEQCNPDGYHALMEVELPQEGEKTDINFQLDPGMTLHGKVQDPQGRPLPGARCRGETPRSLFSQPDDETFTVKQYFPNKPRRLEFWHEQRNLAGWCIVEGPQSRQLAVQLQPCGFLTGRIVDAQGRPIEKAFIRGLQRVTKDRTTVEEPPTEYCFTDENGEYRFAGLAQGLKYNLCVKVTEQSPLVPLVFDAMVTPGEVKDLGDYAPSSVISALSELEQTMSEEQARQHGEIEIAKRVGVIICTSGGNTEPE